MENSFHHATPSWVQPGQGQSQNAMDFSSNIDDVMGMHAMGNNMCVQTSHMNHQVNQQNQMNNSGWNNHAGMDTMGGLATQRFGELDQACTQIMAHIETLTFVPDEGQSFQDNGHQDVGQIMYRWSQQQQQRNSVNDMGQVHGMSRPSQQQSFAPTSESMGVGMEMTGSDRILSDLLINRSNSYNRPFTMTDTLQQPQPHQSRVDSFNDGKEPQVTGFRAYPGNAPPGDEHVQRYNSRQEMTAQQQQQQQQQYMTTSPSSDGLISPTSGLTPQKKPPVAIPRPSMVASNGPAGKSYTLPPRAKPGRKPMKDEPENKRKLQNRQAQRAFRDRRSQKIEQLETLHAEEKQKLEETIAEQTNRAAALHQELIKAKKDRDSWMERAKDFEKEKNSLMAAAKESSAFGSLTPETPQ